MWRLLFPEPARALPGERWVRITLRTAHILSSGILLGGHVFGIAEQRLLVWLWLSIGTGGAFIAVELYNSCIWLLEVRGQLVIAKMLLLCLVPFFWEQRVWLIMLVLVIGSVSSHMPGRFRYYSFVYGGVTGVDKRG